MPAKLILADSNILIYALNDSSPKQKTAQDFLQSHIKQLVLAPQNVFECLRVLTHKKFPNPMTPQAAENAINNIAEACRLIFPDRTAYHLTLALVQKHSLSGDRVFDASLTATAIAADVQVIATDNTKHFAQFEEIEVINPFV